MALWDNIVSYWKLDETAGTKARDFFGSNDGTSSGVTVNQTGIIGKAYAFDDANPSYVSIANESNFDFITAATATFSISLWFNTTTVGYGDKGTLFDKLVGASDLGFNVVMGDRVAGKITINEFTDGSNYRYMTSDSAWNDGEWHHLVISSSAGTLTMYVDGIDESGSWSTTGTYTNGNNSAVVTFGTNDGHNGNKYHGLLDEIGIWSKALSGAEVTTLYAAGVGVSPVLFDLGWVYKQKVTLDTDKVLVDTFESNTMEGWVSGMGTNVVTTEQKHAGTYAIKSTGAEAVIWRTAGGGTYSIYVRNADASKNSSMWIMKNGYGGTAIADAYVYQNKFQYYDTGWKQIGSATASNDTWYKLEIVYVNGASTATYNVYDTSGSLIATATGNTASTGTVDTVQTDTAGQTVYWDDASVTKICNADVTNDHVVLVKVTSTNTDFWANVDSSGNSIRFANVGSTALFKHHLEKFDYAGQEMVAWVGVTDTFTSGANTEFYMYYDNASAVNVADKVGTYPTGYYSVFHMDDAVTPTDSIGNLAATNSASAPTTFSTGKINKAFDFSGTSQYFTTPNYSSTWPKLSFSVWLYPDTTADSQTIFSKWYGVGATGFVLQGQDPPNSNRLYFRVKDASGHYPDSGPTPAMSTGAWHHIVATFNKDGAIAMYLDLGKSISSVAPDGEAIIANTGVITHMAFDVGTLLEFDGKMCEFKIFNSSLSTDEVSLLFASESNTLQSFGAQESGSHAYTQAVVDALTLSAVEIKTPMKPCLSALTMSSSVVKKATRIRADALTMGSNVTKLGSRKFSSSFTLADALSRAATLKRSAADSFRISDALSKLGSRKFSGTFSVSSNLKRDTSRTFNDDFNLTDLVGFGKFLSLADELTINEEPVALGRVVLLIDALTLSESMIKDVDKLIQETITMSSTPTQDIAFEVEDAFSLTDTFEYLRAKILEDALAVQDNIEKLYTGYREYLDSLAMGSNMIKGTEKPLIDALTQSEAFNKNSLKPVTDNLFIGSEVFRDTEKELTDSVIENDTKEWTFGRPVSDAINVTDGVIKDTERIYSDAVTVGSEVYKDAAKEFSEVMTLTEDMLASKLYYEFLADVYGLTDVLFKEVGAVRTDAYLISDSILRDSLRTFTDTFNESDEATKLTMLDKLDQLIMSDGTTGKAYVKIFADIYGISDELITARSLFLTDTINATDTQSQIRGKSLLDTIDVTDIAPTFITKNAFSKFRAHLDYIFNSVPFAEEVTWARYSNTEDELGRASAITEVFSEDISLIVQPLVDSDRSILPQGVNISGYMKAYSKDSYAVTGLGYLTPDIADVILLYNGKKYLVDQVQGKWVGRSEIYRKLILKRIDND